MSTTPAKPTPAKRAKPTTAKKPAAEKPASPVEVSGFEFETGLVIPPQTSGGAGRASETTMRLQVMPVDASFLVPATMPDVIREGEAASVRKETLRKVSNSVSGAINRLTKKDGFKGRVYAQRMVDNKTLGFGVRVWRTA
jgi:hypothetical protein